MLTRQSFIMLHNLSYLLTMKLKIELFLHITIMLNYIFPVELKKKNTLRVIFCSNLVFLSLASSWTCHALGRTGKQYWSCLYCHRFTEYSQANTSISVFYYCISNCIYIFSNGKPKIVYFLILFILSDSWKGVILSYLTD